MLEITATDRASAGNGAKRAVIPGKGRANNRISTEIFKRLEAEGISTHYLAEGSDEQSKYVVKAEPIKLEVIGRFFTAGSFCREYRLPKNIPSRVSLWSLPTRTMPRAIPASPTVK